MKAQIIKRVTSGRYTGLLLAYERGFAVEIYGGEAMMPYCKRRFDSKEDAAEFLAASL
jgi:hypothetical protein